MKFLVTSIGSMSAEAVISRLVLLPDTEVIGCNMYPAPWVPASRLVKRYYQVSSAKEEAAYINQILKICRLEDVTHVIVLTDPEVDILSIYREEFNAVGVMLCIPPKLAVQNARDKMSIYQRFVNHPRIQPIKTIDIKEARFMDFSWPLIAKPRWGRSSEGQVNIPDAGALRFWGERLAEQDYVVQPFHAGDVLVVDVVRQYDSGVSVAMTRQELLRTTNGAGMAVRMLPGHVCGVQAAEAAEILDLQGCINLEFLLVDGTPLLMDVNPRFSAGVAFSIRAGYDMVINHLHCFDGGFLEPYFPPANIVYTRGFVEYSIQD